MLYYRYRPYSEVSLKELMYNEMYFSSPEECNDPFDSKTFYEFSGDKLKLGKLLRLAMEPTKLTIAENLLERLVNHVCSRCPLSFEEALNKDLFTGFTGRSVEENALIKILSFRIPMVLNIYRPSTRYFVSFSAINSDPLLWSHYASKHKGFCLIFKSINGMLSQSCAKRKRQISIKTPNGIAPEMSYGLPEHFEFIKINYENEVRSLDAFSHMPVYVSGEPENENDKLRVINEREEHYVQKSKNWEYEAEHRLMLRPPMPFLFGEHFEFSPQQRLFHYEPSQLVGIIYGSRMGSEEKTRIKQILRDKREWNIYENPNEKKVVFNFFEFDAKLSIKQRSLDVEPVSMISYKAMLPQDPDFERLYKEWLEGWGHERQGGSSKKIKVA
jgi:hypothetical protein